MPLSSRLDAVIAELPLLRHPFYQAWSEGKLPLEVLRLYAAQYARQVEAFPRFVTSVHSRCPEIDARKVLLRNAVDEELHGVDHPELWMRFVDGLGSSRAEVKSAEPLPETSRMVETFFDLTAGPWTEGLCALYAYEAQVPAVAASKLEGLRRFYGLTEPRAVGFFEAHLQYDVEHSRAVAELIDRHAEPESAERATRRATEAQWSFLDGMSRLAGVPCAA